MIASGRSLRIVSGRWFATKSCWIVTKSVTINKQQSSNSLSLFTRQKMISNILNCSTKTHRNNSFLYIRSTSSIFMVTSICSWVLKTRVHNLQPKETKIDNRMNLESISWSRLSKWKSLFNRIFTHKTWKSPPKQN